VRDLEKLRAVGKIIPGLDEMRGGFESTVAEKRLAWLRRAWTSYIVGKCREMTESKTP
jgi:hypothetical protein